MVRMKLHPEALESRDCPAVTLRIDYTYDTNSFFNTQARRDAMQRAADAIGNRLQDNLSAIVPNATALNTWTAYTTNTITNSQIAIPNPTIAANEVVVFVAGGPIAGSAIGIASSGGFSSGPYLSGSNWPNILRGRGQAGAPSSDFAPWGGFIGFDSSVNWNFNPGAPGSQQTDFESVALHEMLHMLGYGLDNVASFSRYISGGNFVGLNAIAAFGGPVPFAAGSDHISNSVVSGGQVSIMVPAIQVGTERVVTPLDWAILKDIGWSVSEPVVPPPPPPPVGASGPVRFFVGSGVGRTPLVAGLNSTGGTVWNAVPFDDDFTGGVRVASGDFNADGILDAVVGTGPGIVAKVRVLDGATRKALFEINPFGSFDGGVNVAAGDITGDGRADLLISPDRGGGPRVRIFQGNGFTQVSDYFGIDDVNFRGGARVAAGDVNGDSRQDVIVAAGFGGGPRIAIFNGLTLGLNGGPKFLGDFFAFEPGLRNGAFIAAGDLDGDGKAELIAGGGPGGGPRVSAFSGANLLQSKLFRIADYFAGSSSNRGGINLAVYDRTGDGREDVITGSGEGFGSTVAVYDAVTISATTPSPIWSSNYFTDNGGIFVG